MIGIEHYIVVSAILFVIGVLGLFLNRKNIIVILMAIELILLAVNLNLVAFSAFLGDLTGQVFAMFVLTVAAGEAAIGLARRRDTRSIRILKQQLHEDPDDFFAREAAGILLEVNGVETDTITLLGALQRLDRWGKGSPFLQV